MRRRVKVSNITCTNCARTIEEHFKKLDSINAKVLVTSGAVIFNYDEKKYSVDFIEEELLNIGYYAIKDSEENTKRRRKDKIDLIIAIIFSIPLLLTMFVHFGITFVKLPDILMNGYFQLAVTTPVLFISGSRFFKAFYHQIRSKNLGMDSLVVIGTLSAYLYSIYETITQNGMSHYLYFETTAVIILMVLIGNYFENRIKERTSSTLTNLLSLGAKEANVIVGDELVLKKIEDLKIGDIVSIKGYEKIPIDGEIIKGKTYVDESMLTGESMPVLKKVGDEVIGSSMNIMESINIRVTKFASETVLSKIIQTVEETNLIKPKVQKVADKIASVFVPIVVILSLIVFLLYVFVAKEQLELAIAPAISVLVVSCPCALGLATPTSISVSSGMAFKEGVLYKGGEFFETANKITAIAFDKTGTLTRGKPVVTNYIGDDKYLVYTASLEASSNHPIASAITKYYSDNLGEVKDFKTLIGYGISGNIESKNVHVVSLEYLNKHNILNPYKEYDDLLKEGKTIFFTLIDSKVVNLIAVSDKLKEDSVKVIKELKRRGIKTYMITGDQEKTARYFAEKIGIDDVYAKVLPHEKANIIKKIKETNSVVAFVGDGINDAPALKMADVGFAIGSGSDIAIDTSDVTLMNSSLESILYAIDLSKATLRNIYLNFFWAFIYNIIMIPLAALKIFNPTLAGIGMAFSSIMVVLNALRLKKFRFKYGEKKNENN